MISDEKRREVAAKLCAEAESWRYYREDDSAFCMNDYEFTEAVLEDFGFSDMDMPAYEVFNQMADIVDRPTCMMFECSIDHGSRSWGMRCTACGKEFEHMKPGFGWRFCPNCGAVVVEKGEDDG